LVQEPPHRFVEVTPLFSRFSPLNSSAVTKG
jgi:hypothetical protein